MIKRISSLLQCILIPVVLFLLILVDLTATAVVTVLFALIAYTAVGVYCISDILMKWRNKSRF